MALNFLVELRTEKTDWKKLCKKMTIRSSQSVEFFPIPNFRDINKNHLGISVLNNEFLEKESDFLKTTIQSLINDGHKVFELYSSNEFTNQNISSLINQLLKRSAG